MGMELDGELVLSMYYEEDSQIDYLSFAGEY